MSSKVPKDDHDQLVCFIVVNNKTGSGIDVNLKFRWVEQEKRISFMSVIWLGAVFDMGSPEACDGFRICDPVVFRWIRNFQL